MLSPAATERRRVTLPTGTLDIAVEAAHWPLDSLCDFAGRHNPRRGFLIVSRVLGRHIPARPAAMRRSAAALAGLLPHDLPGPVLVIGLAETAVCLGQTLHREWRALTGRDDLFFLQTTRQRIDHPLLCRFEEPHSHASAHLVYRPLPAIPVPRSLVLVDDEISTGTTLANCATALLACWPGVEAVATAALTDWSDGAWRARIGRPAPGAALLNGRLRWTPDAAATHDGSAAGPGGTGALGNLPVHRNRGRLGMAGDPDLPGTLPALDPAQPLRIVGTGEFTYPPFLVAEALERAGYDVVVQATSRSPVRIGGAIASRLVFADPHATGVPNFLYNARPDGRATWICHEAATSIDPVLVDALGAATLEWPA